jgi:transposase-like protein
MNWYKIIKIAGKHLTQEQIYQILEMYGKDVPVIQISEKLGIPKYTIDKMLMKFLGKRNRSIKFSPQQEQEIIHLYTSKEKGGEGLTIRQIGNKLNVSSSALINFFRKRGIPIIPVKEFNKIKVSPEIIREIIVLYNKGISLKQLSNRYNIGLWALHRIFKEHGAKLRNQAEIMEKLWEDPAYVSKTTDILNKNRKKVWLERGNFWTWLKKFPIEKRIEIVKGMWATSYHKNAIDKPAVRILIQKAIGLGPPDPPIVQPIETSITNPPILQNTEIQT